MLVVTTDFPHQPVSSDGLKCLYCEVIFIMCCGLNVHIPPRFICWQPNPQCDGICRWWGHTGGALMNGTVSLQKGPHPFLHGRTQWEDSTHEPRSELSSDTEYPSASVLDFSASRVMRNKLWLFKSSSLWWWCYCSPNRLRQREDWIREVFFQSSFCFFWQGPRNLFSQLLILSPVT